MKTLPVFTAALVSTFLVCTLMSSPLTPTHAFAQTSATSPVSGLSTCQLNFEVKGTDIQILVGYSRLKGQGVITCRDDAGQTTSTKMKVTIGTPVLFPRISFAPSLTVRGASDEIRILKGGPAVIFGKYLTLDIRIAVGGGRGTSLALEGEENGLSINLSLQDVEGFGLAAGGTIVTFEKL